MAEIYRIWAAFNAGIGVSVFGIFFLGEITTWRFWTGGLMIFGSVVILNRVGTRAKSVPKSRLPEPQATG